MPLDPAAAGVLAAYQRSSESLRDRIIAYVRRAWVGLDNYRDVDIDRFVAAVAPVVEAGQYQVAALTDAYLAAVEAALLGDAVQPIGIGAQVVSTEALRGVPALEVWRRPGLSVWNALSKGADLTTAVGDGLARALEIGETNLQLAHTHASRAVLATKPNVVGYRRAPRRVGACDLCRVAATQRYRRSDLQPIHPRCRCTVLPIYGAKDPGRVIPARTQPEIDLTEHDHGEIGPVLALAGDHFTGPSAIP